MELINHPNYRNITDINQSNKFFPFTAEVIEETLGHIDRISTRKINETFSMILELALISENVPTEINMQFVNSIKNEIPAWKESL